MPSRVGDGLEYVAMTKALSEFQLPAYSSSELQDFYKWSDIQNYVGFSGVRLEFPSLVGFDGRQDFLHFWFYSMLAVPFWWLLSVLHLPVLHSFTLLNIALITLSLRIGLTAYKPLSLLLILASPIIWFVNKAHTEVFTFALVIIGVTLASRGLFLFASTAFAAASTQNIPWIPLAFFFLGLSIIQNSYSLKLTLDSISLDKKKSLLRVLQDKKKEFFKYLLLVSLSIFLALIHILYYFIRIKFITPTLAAGAISSTDFDPTKYFAVLIDPDIGLIPNLPIQSIVCIFVALFLLVVVIIKFRSYRSYRFRNLGSQPWTAIGFTLLSFWLLLSFSKAVNVNSGATINISRYALWLVPMMLPYLHIGLENIDFRIWSRFKTLLELIYPLIFLFYIFYCSPFLQESYLSQTYISRKFYDFFPCVYQPVPEIFIERNTGAESASISVSNPSCSLTFSRFGIVPSNCNYTKEEIEDVERNVSVGKLENWIVRKGSLNLCVPRVTSITDSTYSFSDVPSLNLAKSDLFNNDSIGSFLNISGLSGIEMDELKINTWRWALGPRTIINFNLKEPKLLSMLFEFDNPIQSQDVTVELNGRVLEKFTNLSQGLLVKGNTELDVRQGINVITFRYRYWNHNQITFAPNDPRLLAIVFKKLEIK